MCADRLLTWISFLIFSQSPKVCYPKNVSERHRNASNSSERCWRWAEAWRANGFPGNKDRITHIHVCLVSVNNLTSSPQNTMSWSCVNCANLSYWLWRIWRQCVHKYCLHGTYPVAHGAQPQMNRGCISRPQGPHGEGPSMPKRPGRGEGPMVHTRTGAGNNAHRLHLTPGIVAPCMVHWSLYYLNQQTGFCRVVRYPLNLSSKEDAPMHIWFAPLQNFVKSFVTTGAVPLVFVAAITHIAEVFRKPSFCTEILEPWVPKHNWRPGK